MSLVAELGMEDVDLGAAESAIASGGLPPVGVHHAVLDGVREFAANSGTKGRELTFKIIAGPGKGCEVEDAVFLPHDGQDEEKKKTTKNKLAIAMHRLGLLKKVKGPDGKDKTVAVEGKSDFLDCIGTTCFIEVKHVMRKYQDKSGADQEIKEAKLTFEGILSPDDKKCKDVPRGTAPAPSSRPAAKPADNFDDL